MDVNTVPATPSPAPHAPDWDAVRTVCLDMDGTVLDLHFDNLFWLDALPRRWGEKHGVPAERALAELRSRFDARRGTLEWYCIDHWSEELDFDIAALKLELREHIRYLPGAIEFLDAVSALGKRLVLTTNAHPISLGVKNGVTGLERHFDALVSSHEFGIPKEQAEFWQRLEVAHGVAPAATLFVDDSATVLEAARQAGVGQVYQVLLPDSTQPPRTALPGFAVIRGLGELVP
ncbi:MAG: GMP/IMP nucleotidase [Steroidobacteraceae bacterium]|nr:GMP/IMP nucleotidase [Steroidobacteraceae bacterium]